MRRLSCFVCVDTVAQNMQLPENAVWSQVEATVEKGPQELCPILHVARILVFEGRPKSYSFWDSCGWLSGG